MSGQAAPVAAPQDCSGSKRTLWPARLDVAQSGSGLLLALFMWLHMFFVSSILLGNDAMWTVARFFEGYFLFGRRLPGVVAGLVGTIIALFVLHACLALRKVPASLAAQRSFTDHMGRMRHGDTTLWYWQAVTGFVLMFVAPLHLGTMLTRPDRIGPFESADRVWSDSLWPVYLVLLLAVELHAGIGMYRLALKWGWPAHADPAIARNRLRVLKWLLTVGFLGLGIASLVAYMVIGLQHAPHYGEPYLPSVLSRGAP